MKQHKVLKDKPKSNWPENMSEAFHRARRNLILVSSILLSWEFLGITFEEVFKAQIIGASLKLENPQNITVLIFLSVIFFLIRFFSEWYQSNPIRRAQLATRLDFTTTVVIALASIGLFLYQTIANVNIFSDSEAIDTIYFIGSAVTFSLVTTMLANYVGCSLFYHQYKTYEPSNLIIYVKSPSIRVSIIIICVIVNLIITPTGSVFHSLKFGLAVFGLFLFMVLFYYLTSKFTHKKLSMMIN